MCDETTKRDLIELGERIKNIRESQKITQEKMSLDTEISRQTISSIENGENGTTANLVKISNYLDSFVSITKDYDFPSFESDMNKEELIKTIKCFLRFFIALPFMNESIIRNIVCNVSGDFSNPSYLIKQLDKSVENTIKLSKYGELIKKSFTSEYDWEEYFVAVSKIWTTKEEISHLNDKLSEYK